MAINAWIQGKYILSHTHTNYNLKKQQNFFPIHLPCRPIGENQVKRGVYNKQHCVCVMGLAIVCNMGFCHPFSNVEHFQFI